MKTSLLKGIFFLTFCLILHLSTSAQLNELNRLRKADNVTWMSEFSTDYYFSLDTAFTTEKFKLTKLIMDNNSFEGANRGDWIKKWIFENAVNGSYECFEDPGLMKSIKASDLKKRLTTIDTVVVFNADTYEEMVHIIKSEIGAFQVIGFRTNQVLYYKESTGTFHTHLISLAPLLTHKASIVPEKFRQSKKPYPAFWIKMNDPMPANFDASSSDITWSALVYSIKHPWQFNFAQELKKTSDFNIIKNVYGQVMEGKIKAFYSFSNASPMTVDEVKKVFSSRDTVTTFDPTTFEETVQIISNNIDPKDLDQFRVIQEWYYDKKLKRLYQKLVAVAPLMRVKNKKDKYMYTRPIYYLKN